MKCPEHKAEMLRRQTQYGPLHICTVDDCTVMKWGDSANTTPANKQTREARHAAHVIFDRLWQDGHVRRSWAYTELARRMKITRDAAHIGLFNIAECDWVIRISNDMQREILMRRFT